MKATVSERQPFWLPTALFAGCLILAFVAPIIFLVLRWEILLSAALLLSLHMFPMEARRMPDLPSGIQAGPIFRYELGALPVILTWVSALLVFGWLAGRFGRGLRLWQLIGLVALTIGVVTIAMQVVLQHFGFRPNMTPL